jgi:hypothetical protein
MSAVSSVSTPGVLVTVMPLAVAVSTSILSTPVPKVGDQLELVASLHDDRLVDPVGDGRDQYFCLLYSIDQLCLAHRLIGIVERGGKQLPHPRFDNVGQFACDDDRWFACRHSLCSGRDASVRRAFLTLASGTPCPDLLQIISAFLFMLTGRPCKLSGSAQVLFDWRGLLW